jgi:hypothetical protein
MATCQVNSKAYLLSGENVRAELDLAESAFAQGLAHDVVTHGLLNGSLHEELILRIISVNFRARKRAKNLLR